jgi:uncharacterized protein
MNEDKVQVILDLVKLVVVCVVALFISNLLAFLVALPFTNFDLQAIILLLQNPLGYPETRTALMLMQGIIALCVFIVAPTIYVSSLDKTLSFKDIFQKNSFSIALILGALAVIIAVMEMPWVGWLGQWNNEWVFPDAFEKWARSKEEDMKELTIFLTEFRSFEQFLLGFVVIAILPGIGEELLFRGVLQNKLKQLFGNVHIAIWLTAILFSAIHFQFYGFAPRMLLGAVFGYLYHWTGNLTYAMLAHFINNGFTILMMYLFQQQQIEMNIDAETIPLENAMVSLGLTSILLFMFYKISVRLEPKKQGI